MPTIRRHRPVHDRLPLPRLESKLGKQLYFHWRAIRSNRWIFIYHWRHIALLRCPPRVSLERDLPHMRSEGNGN